MPRYLTRYVHKIAPKETDTGDPIELAPKDLVDKRALAGALRRANVLAPGQALSSFRIENDRVIAFPKASIWHSIILHLPGTAALPPKKTGPDTYQKFTYKPPIGSGGSMRRFHASSPVTWAEARDRLISAGVIDTAQHGWLLSVDPHDYVASRSEDLP